MRVVALLLFGLLLQSCATSNDGSASAGSQDTSTRASGRRVNELFESYSWDVGQFSPLDSTANGNHRFDHLLADNLSDEHRAKLKAYCSRYLSELDKINVGELSKNDRLSVEIFRYQLERCLENLNFDSHLLSISPASSLPATFALLGTGKGAHPFKTVKNYEDFLARMDGFVVWVDSAVRVMRFGIKKGITQPKALMVKVLPQLQEILVDDPTHSGFYQPVRQFPASFDDATRARLETAYRQAIAQKVMPAYRKLVEFIRDEYLTACRPTAGLWDVPGGAAMYDLAVRNNTNTNLSADEIFAIGQKEVARIRTEMEQVRRQISTTSAPPEPTRYSDRAAIVKAYENLGETVYAKISKWFGNLPQAGIEIRTIEPFREQSTSSNYVVGSPDGKRPGVFYLSAAGIEARPQAISIALYLHEAVPGHHFQMSLQRENKELPLFRRFGFYNSYSEGWGLYTEKLGIEMGVYANPYDQLDRLKMEMTRAVRLVVDTGIHAKRWTREQAIAYLQKNTGNSEEFCTREVERYMSWPGQALAYKIGELKILELRQRAEARLGPAFDPRAFHDEILKDGGMPLTILERKINGWIEARSNAVGGK